MSVSVCIASRGRPELLAACVSTLVRGAVYSDTILSVALDADDDRLAEYQADAAALAGGGIVRYSVGAREDSLGAKYNRAQRNAPADLYVLWADDQVMPEPGWDYRLVEAARRFPDGQGVVFFGQVPGVLQPGIAVTHRFVDGMGFFCVPYFPFWWHDTWLIEMGHMTGRVTKTEIPVVLLQELRGASRGVREIAFWAELFDRLRPARREAAERLIRRSADAPHRKTQLLARLPEVERLFLERNAPHRDPEHARRLEAFYGFDAPADARYARLKHEAERMLQVL